MSCDVLQVSAAAIKAVISVSPGCVLSDMQRRLIHQEAVHNNILISLPQSASLLPDVEN